MRYKMIERRKQLNLTQEEVSAVAKVSRNTYSSYETGVITPSLEVAFRIKKALKTTKDDIFLIINDSKNDIADKEEVI